MTCVDIAASKGNSEVMNTLMTFNLVAIASKITVWFKTVAYFSHMNIFLAEQMTKTKMANCNKLLSQCDKTVRDKPSYYSTEVLKHQSCGRTVFLPISGDQTVTLTIQIVASKLMYLTRAFCDFQEPILLVHGIMKSIILIVNFKLRSVIQMQSIMPLPEATLR